MEMNIALCFDRNIVEQAGVLMVSILETNRNNNIVFHIVHDGSFLRRHYDILKNIADKYERQIHFYQTNDQLNNIPKTSYSPATFIRLFLPELIPKIVKKILYLDIDMIVVDDLKPLFEMDLEDNYFASCIDDSEYSTQTFNRLGLDFNEWRGEPYFNTGMMLIDLDKWRELNLSQLTINYMTENDSKDYRFADQDVLNYLFHGKVKIADSRYNLLLNFMTDYTLFDIRREKYPMIEKALENPCIIHLYGYEHPWYKDCQNPYCKIWRYYAGLSGIEMKYQNYFHHKARVRRALRNILSKFRLCASAKLQYKEINFERAEKLYKKLSL